MVGHAKHELDADAHQRTRFPYGESVILADLELTAEQLAVAAVVSAHDGIWVLERLGLEPDAALYKRAAGDPAQVTAFVEAHS